MDKESAIIQKIMKDKRLIRLVKSSLSHLLNKLIEDEKFPKDSLLSGNEYRMGNIGYADDPKDLELKINYLTSKDSTIREKVTAISNTIINGSDKKSKNVDNTKKLLKKIIEYKPKVDQESLDKSWIYKRQKQIRDIQDLNIPIKESHMWAPVDYLYPTYLDKYASTRDLIRSSRNYSKSEYHIKESELLEPLSEFETLFLKGKVSKGFLPYITGKYIYSDAQNTLICRYEESKNERPSKDLIVGGISGHTILLVELAKLVNVNWIPIVFGCMISQFPHHHSLIEIFDALKDMKIMNFASFDGDNYLGYIGYLGNHISVNI